MFYKDEETNILSGGEYQKNTITIITAKLTEENIDVKR